MIELLRRLKSFLLRQRSARTLRTRAAAMMYLPSFIRVESVAASNLPNSALVFAPHPDDETLGCGGTLALMKARGARIQILCATGGELGERTDGLESNIRVKEFHAACRRLGMDDVMILDGSDGALRFDTYLRQELAESLRQMKPEACFLPWPGDNHDDHVALFEHVLYALRECGHDPQIWLYEVWSPLAANRTVNIDSTIGIKAAALEEYATQNRTLDLVERFRALARYRSFSCRNSRYAEAFLVGDIGFVQRLTHEVFRSRSFSSRESRYADSFVIRTPETGFEPRDTEA